MPARHRPSDADWSVCNLGWHALTFAPDNLFDRSLALDLQPVPAPPAP